MSRGYVNRFGDPVTLNEVTGPDDDEPIGDDDGLAWADAYIADLDKWQSAESPF